LAKIKTALSRVGTKVRRIFWVHRRRDAEVDHAADPIDRQEEENQILVLEIGVADCVLDAQCAAMNTKARLTLRQFQRDRFRNGDAA
jgi:hypothetical protein